MSKLVKTAGFFLAFAWALSAARAAQMSPGRQPVLVSIEYGEPAYKSVSQLEIQSIAGLKNPLRTMGVTVAKLKTTLSPTFAPKPLAGFPHEDCYVLSTVDFGIGYESMEVLVDEKYKPGTCEYEAITKHERVHIGIYFDELEYYGRLLDEELKIVKENQAPVCVPKGNKHKAERKLHNTLKNNERLALLMSRLANSLYEKNQDFDTEEEYLRVRSECSSW
ncbi:MAG: hypothetical protein LBO78_03685 [Rickettsiales bacterium]|jgi:hypothetical protein|nr:hypothetical protein [Rickettsiales bacterium]